MRERMEDHDPANDLTAFADGELDAARSAEVVEYLSARPEAARAVAQSMRFRAAIGRAARTIAPPPSQVVHEQIQSLLGSDRQSATVKGSIHIHAPGAFWFKMAVAAMLFIAVGVGFDRLVFSPKLTSSGPVPATLVATVTHIHVDCSRAPSEHNHPFPHELGDLADAVKRSLNRATPYPDLSPIGYQYIGAGPCGKLVEGTAHLLYRSTRGPVTDTVSLFIQSFHDQMPLAEGKVYWAQGKGSAHPMLVWRKGNLVFFFVGDAAEPIVDAARLMNAPVGARSSSFSLSSFRVRVQSPGSESGFGVQALACLRSEFSL